MWEKLKEWTKNMPVWAQIAIYTMVGAIFAIGTITTIGMTSCTASHAVEQSAATSTYKTGDTTVVSTTIRYEQTGNIQK